MVLFTAFYALLSLDSLFWVGPFFFFFLIDQTTPVGTQSMIKYQCVNFANETRWYTNQEMCTVGSSEVYNLFY